MRTSLLFATPFVALGIGLLGPGMATGQSRGNPADVAARIKQVKAVEPMSWTKIPWVANLVEARRLSAQEKVPVFLFALNGNVAAGRC